VKIEDFQKHAHEIVDWLADYYKNIEKYPVKPQLRAGEILSQLPASPPQAGENFPQIFADFERIIVPGLTHWQHPGFYAYFPSNTSYPSLLAEMLVAGLAQQCMSWETSPAATELEEQMMKWLAELLGLPAAWSGVIQDTASTSTLVSLLTARERASDFAVNEKGFYSQAPLRIYASTEAHSSVEKALKVLGFGRENFIKIGVQGDLSMNVAALRERVAADRAAGLQPMAVVAALGTTSTTAFDDLKSIASFCKQERIWLHVDAAYAGSVFVLPELRHHLAGVEDVDSFVVNPHKWFFTHFDCSAYFVKDAALLVRSLEILPEYLKAQQKDTVKNYRDWGLALGRRFRALKLWFVMRSMGVEGLQAAIRQHLAFAKFFESELRADSEAWEIVTPTSVNLVCFRSRLGDDGFNQELLLALNATGRFYLSHTRVGGRYVLRFVAGQRLMEERHVRDLLETLRLESQRLLKSR
jgi:aromatic-L-amino-acid decarboxylase